MTRLGAILKCKLELPRKHGSASNIPDLPQWSEFARFAPKSQDCLKYMSRVPLKTTIRRGTRQTLSHVMAFKSEFYYIHVKKTDWFGNLVYGKLGQIWYNNQFRAKSGILIISGQIWQKSGMYWGKSCYNNLAKNGANLAKSGANLAKNGANLAENRGRTGLNEFLGKSSLCFRNMRRLQILIRWTRHLNLEMNLEMNSGVTGS